MRAAHDTGVPLCRGMYLDWPERDEAYRFDQYLFGEAFLVAPAMRPSGDGQHGVTERSLWLPEGAWYDYFTGKRLEGGCEITRTSDIRSFPLYVRAGSLVPMTEPGDYVSAPLTTLTLRAYAPVGNCRTTFDLYEDEGENFDYEKGLNRRTLLTYDCSDGIQRLSVETPRGDYPEAVAERTCNVEIVGTPKPALVTVNGVVCNTWSWDNDLLTVHCGTFSATQPVTIEIR